MSELSVFLSSNAALLAALLALVISLRANFIAHQAHKLNLRNRADTQRIQFFEKKRELLNEVDHQHTRFATLMMLTAQKVLLFREHPSLHDTMNEEFDRLKSNLKAIQRLYEKYEKQRQGIESINIGEDIAVLDEVLASIHRLTIHVEKDIAHEQAYLNELRTRLGNAPL